MDLVEGIDMRLIRTEFDSVTFDVTEHEIVEYAASCGDTDPRFTDPAHLDFQAPSRLHDVLAIDVAVGEIGSSSFRFDFRIRNRARNVTVATGHTVHCAVDAEFVPMRVPDEFRSTIAAFEHWDH